MVKIKKKSLLQNSGNCGMLNLGNAELKAFLEYLKTGTVNTNFTGRIEKNDTGSKT